MYEREIYELTDIYCGMDIPDFVVQTTSADGWKYAKRKKK